MLFLRLRSAIRGLCACVTVTVSRRYTVAGVSRSLASVVLNCGRLLRPFDLSLRRLRFNRRLSKHHGGGRRCCNDELLHAASSC